MRRFVAEHAADAAAAAAGGGSTRCSIFTLCLIADLGVDYINLIPHACALPLRRREGDRLMAGEGDGVVLILAGGVLFSFLFERSPADSLLSFLVAKCGWEGERRGEGEGEVFIERRN